MKHTDSIDDLIAGYDTECPKGCKYSVWLGSYHCCNYFEMTGKPRILTSPKSGEFCTAYEATEGYTPPKRKVVNKTASRFDAGCAKLYAQGKTDLQISQILHCSKSVPWNWRKRHRKPSNKFAELRQKQDKAIEIGRRIQAERLKRGLSIAQEAKSVGIASSTMQHYENGYILICDKKLKKLEKYWSDFDAQNKDKRIGNDATL